MSTTSEPDRQATRGVLVIDDNMDLALSLASLLRFYGCRVDVAHNGHEGLRMALQGRYDVVFIDIGLPGMSGYEVVRLIRGALENPPLLLAQTAYGQPEDVRMSREAGFDAHLTKPVDPGEIVRRVFEDRSAAPGGRGGGEGDADLSALRVRGSPREAPSAEKPALGSARPRPVVSITPAAG